MDASEVPSGLMPQLRLDELLAEVQVRLQALVETRDRMHGLLEAVVAIGSGLELEAMLRRIVEAAVELAGADYGALGVIGPDQQLTEFIPVGLTPSEIRGIHHWPEGHGLLGLLIKDPRPLRLDDIRKHPESSGFPEGHPAMRSFLGVPVRVRDRVFGNLYLTQKRGGGEFTDDDEALVTALGAAAGVAVENARMYDEARRQQGWQRASVDIATQLLSGASPGTALAALARQALELADADLVTVALPDDQRRRLTIEYAEGDGANDARGLVLPVAGSLSGLVLSTGEPLATDDFAEDERAYIVARQVGAHIEHAIIFPLGAPGDVRGVLSIARRRGALPFPKSLTEVMASFAAQAGVALELAGRRAAAERLSVIEDRDRIARDLHDLVIQRLYATGMSLEGTMPMISRPEVADRITNAVDAMDETIKVIRTTIFALQSRTGTSVPKLRTQVVELADEAAGALGFAPALRLGSGLDAHANPVVAEQALAVLREALSNVARHAKATKVDVAAEVDASGILTLRVTDNGMGMGPNTRRSGLLNLANRAEELGGEMTVTSPADGGGTELEWRVPLLSGSVVRPGWFSGRFPRTP